MLSLMSSVYSSSSTEGIESSSESITYDSDTNVITITCEGASLTDINNEIRNPDTLHKEKN
jgi:hypothetical protein